MRARPVCEEPGISARQLARWRDELRLLGDDAFLGKNALSAGEEVTRLKKELAEVKRERDFLKDVVVFFAKAPK
jgi:transposase